MSYQDATLHVLHGHGLDGDHASVQRPHVHRFRFPWWWQIIAVYASLRLFFRSLFVPSSSSSHGIPIVALPPPSVRRGHPSPSSWRPTRLRGVVRRPSTDACTRTARAHVERVVRTLPEVGPVPAMLTLARLLRSRSPEPET